jgi:hypothetical protein
VAIQVRWVAFQRFRKAKICAISLFLGTLDWVGVGDYVNIVLQEIRYRYIILDPINPHFYCYVIVVAKDCPKSSCERKCVVFFSLCSAFSDLSRGCPMLYFCSVWCCVPLHTDGSNRFPPPSL